MAFYNPQEMGRAITILDEGLVLTTNVSSIDFTGAGITGSVLGDAVTENVSGGGSSSTVVNYEAPSGAIDGSNTVFTWAHTPLYGVQIALNGSIVSPEAGDFTTTGATTTFNVPPAPGSVIVGFYEY